MNATQQKGRDLEESVYFIQKTVLETDPRYRGLAFTIARNEHCNIDGVRHEIDVIVRVSPGTDYEAMLLFECKNWSTTVGKNEVIVLSEKIDALSAARGFLVARSFSPDAEAQAKKDPRIKLITCASDFQSSLSLQLVHQQTDLLNIEVIARIVGPDKSPIEPCTLAYKEIWMLRDRPVVLAEIIKQHADHFYREHFKREGPRLVLEGTHHGTAPGRVEFDPGELTSGSRTMEWMNLVCHYHIVSIFRRIRSQFDLHGYGRTYAFEPFEADGNAIEVMIVMRAAASA